MKKLKLSLILGLLNCIYITSNSYASISSRTLLNNGNDVYNNNKNRILFNISTMKDFFKLHSGKNYGWSNEKRPKIKFINVSGEIEFINDSGEVLKKYVSLVNFDKELLKNKLKDSSRASKWIENKLLSLGEYSSGIKFTTVYSDKSKILEGDGIIKESKFNKLNLNILIDNDDFRPTSIPSLAYKLKDLDKHK